MFDQETAARLIPFAGKMFDIKLDINDIKKYINQDEFFLLKNSMERGIPVKFVPYLYDEKKYDNTYCSKICGYILGSTKTYHIDTALCKVNNQNNKEVVYFTQIV